MHRILFGHKTPAKRFMPCFPGRPKANPLKSITTVVQRSGSFLGPSLILYIKNTK